jgi:hypothetical protein
VKPENIGRGIGANSAIMMAAIPTPALTRCAPGAARVEQFERVERQLAALAVCRAGALEAWGDVTSPVSELTCPVTPRL